MKSFGSANIKIALLLTGILIVIATYAYTQFFLVTEILQREREIANLYAKSIEFIANDENQSGEYNFIFNTVINSNSINFPIVVTDAKNNKPTFIKNLGIDSTLPKYKQDDLLQRIIEKMDEENKPIKVSANGIILSYVHYGQSDLITRLELFPVIAIIVVSIFIFIGYFGFNYIKRTEQSNLWVGLSKETAHQLGTPLSSLMGWNELIKENINNPEKVLSLTHEMSNDLDRLSKIANRFSKIGSKADLKYENLYEVIEKVKIYFEKRIPRLRTEYSGENNEKRKVKLEINGSKDITVLINRELFEWVIENLTKNALDAIESNAGTISYDVQDKGNHIQIDVWDTGKGLELRYKKDIFRPGFSTKLRGWGLGLSLSKRIIESYHKGKLLLKESEVGKGSTFRIKLRKISTQGKL